MSVMSMQLNEINERERERRRVNSTQRDPAHPSVDHFSLDINYKKQKRKASEHFASRRQCEIRELCQTENCN